SQQSEPVLLDHVLTMPALRGPVLSKPSHARQIQRPSGRTVLLKPSNLFEYPRSSGCHALMPIHGLKPATPFIQHFCGYTVGQRRTRKRSRYTIPKELFSGYRKTKLYQAPVGCGIAYIDTPACKRSLAVITRVRAS